MRAITLQERILELASRGALPVGAVYRRLSDSHEAIDAAVKSLRAEGRLVLEHGHFRCAESGGNGIAATVRRRRRAHTCARLGDPLTLREVEIADMAAAGCTSQQIAGALGVTKKTVEGCLSRVYAKLGVGGRAALAGALTVREGVA